MNNLINNLQNHKQACTHYYKRNVSWVETIYDYITSKLINTTQEEVMIEAAIEEARFSDQVKDWYEQGSVSEPISDFTETLLDWLETPKR